MQVEQAQSKIAEMNAALGIAQQRGDQVNIDRLTAGLANAQENLSNLQFGPVLERMRSEMAQVAASWEGTQSGMLAKQIQIAQAELADTQQSAKQRLQVTTEVAQLEVRMRQAVGGEVVAAAKAQNQALTADTGLSAVQRLERERDTWIGVLANDRVVGAQRLEAALEFNAAYAGIQRERVSQAAAIARSDASTDIAISQIQLEAKRSALEQEVQADKISAAQKLQTMRQLAAESFNLDLQMLDSELSTLQAGTAAYEEVFNKIRELKAKLTADLEGYDSQYAKDCYSRASWPKKAANRSRAIRP